MAHLLNAPTACPRCGSAPYGDERIFVLGRDWHKLCFKCKGCGARLTRGKENEHQGEIYCAKCYGEGFGQRGYGYGKDGGVLSSHARPEKQAQPTYAPSHASGGASGGSSSSGAVPRAPAASLPRKFCTGCGTKCTSDAAFCGSCGARQ
eukprot:CAMPEP_0177658920 /NCGR_PEP_ID=MMETSP0447-20121125/17136_1 /TAXON_ID=0 /ORGANISM="Stygamoeba regulata, Strain BSH-02190019" /LENGTH=148 /DNA_ID=CAMNT_0019163695 /DNA_START=70 /DNA_END=516 /DNA_ORIENTATION=+